MNSKEDTYMCEEQKIYTNDQNIQLQKHQAKKKKLMSKVKR